MSEQALTRPVPYPSPISEPFWEACRRHELIIQHCDGCDAFVFYPRATCTSCGSEALTWQPATGRGILFTFTIARRPTHRRLASRVPYVIAVVELEEGPHLTSTVVDCDIETLCIGQRVLVDFEDLDDVAIPVFKLTD